MKKDKMTITEALILWKKQFPDFMVSRQTIINWCNKYEFGEKSSPLKTSKYLIDTKKFIKFINKI